MLVLFVHKGLLFLMTYAVACEKFIQVLNGCFTTLTELFLEWYSVICTKELIYDGINDDLFLVYANEPQYVYVHLG